jgi:hypothetical protein
VALISSVPAISEWGAVVMALSILATGSVVLRFRLRTSPGDC